MPKTDILNSKHLWPCNNNTTKFNCGQIHGLSEAMARRIREAGIPVAVCQATLVHLSSLSMVWQCAASSCSAGFDKTRERRRHTDSLLLHKSASTTFLLTSHSGINVIYYYSPPSIKECITCPIVQPVKGQCEIWDFTAVKMTMLFWVVIILCRLTGRNRRFKETLSPHHVTTQNTVIM
jgi:hypothetical protein